jgi:hypothetical protein
MAIPLINVPCAANMDLKPYNPFERYIEKEPNVQFSLLENLKWS